MNPNSYPDLFLEVVGAFIGDGFINVTRNRHFILGFSGHWDDEQEYYRDVIIPGMASMFPAVRACVRQKADCNGIEARFNSKEVVRRFEEWFGFTPGPKSDHVSIPRVLLELPWEKLALVIRGIFDTDGTLYFDKRKTYKQPYPRIALQTSSGPLHAQLKELLSRYFSLYSTQNNRGAYVLEIYGRKQLDLWLKAIGFSNPRHLTKL